MPSRLTARLQRLEAQRQATEAYHGHGLAALLAFARRPGQTPPVTLDADAPLTGLARLLQDAQEEQAREPRA
jgi:hypothetical protein